MALVTYIDAINQALHEEMKRDDRVFVIGEDVGLMGGAFRATKGLLDEFGPDRCIDSPLAEGIIVSSSIGAALAGMHPVPEIQFSDFITPALDAILEQAAKLRYRSAGTQTCPLTLRVCYGGGVQGGLYHSQTNTTWFAHEPGLRVIAPGTVADAKGMLKAAIRDDNPTIYFEHKKLYRSIKDELPESDFVADLDKCAIRREGADVTVVSYGYTLQLCMQAMEKLTEKGIDAELIDLRTLNPIDHETILNSVAKTSRLTIVQEDHRTLGIGSEISAVVAEQAFDCLDAPITRVTAPDIPAIPFSAPLEKFYMPSVEKIIEAVERCANY